MRHPKHSGPRRSALEGEPAEHRSHVQPAEFVQHIPEGHVPWSHLQATVQPYCAAMLRFREDCDYRREESERHITGVDATVAHYQVLCDQYVA